MSLYFYIMVGISGSGKSTISKKIIEDMEERFDIPTAYISTDEIREELTGDYSNQEHNNEVFNLFYKRINQFTEEKRNIVVDATNLSIKYRRVILNNIKNRAEYDVIAYIMSTDINTCYTRNELRPKPVPKDVIYRQVHNFEIPFFEEGFNHIYIHDIYEEKYHYYESKTQAYDKTPDNCLLISASLVAPMRGFDQRNHWHEYDLFTHSQIVANKIILMYELQPDDKDYILIKAAMLHDYGKLFTAMPKKDFSGEYTYYNHANVGAYLLLNKNTIKFIHFNFYEDVLDFLFYINYHMFPFDWKTAELHDKYRKIFGDVKYNKLMILHRMDETSNEKAEHYKNFNDFGFYVFGEK